MTCKQTDFMYPLLADIYYSNVEQSAYGSIEKQWILNKTIACFFAIDGKTSKEEVKPTMSVTMDQVLTGRSKCDPRFSEYDSKNAITNIIISNIRDVNNKNIYIETAGVRSGKSTIFEIATVEPMVGPFGTVEYYKLVIRRSQNQGENV